VVAMEYFADLVLTHGPYVAICLVITFMLTAAKRSFPAFFKSVWGMRCLYFAPAILGAALGMVFLTEGLKLSLLYGMACGTVSQSVYAIVTKALQPKAQLRAQVVARDSLVDADD